MRHMKAYLPQILLRPSHIATIMVLHTDSWHCRESLLRVCSFKNNCPSRGDLKFENCLIKESIRDCKVGKA